MFVGATVAFAGFSVTVALGVELGFFVAFGETVASALGLLVVFDSDVGFAVSFSPYLSLFLTYHQKNFYNLNHILSDYIFFHPLLI